MEMDKGLQQEMGMEEIRLTVLINADRLIPQIPEAVTWIRQLHQL